MNEQNESQDATIKDKIRKVARDEFAEIFLKIQDLGKT